MDKAKFALSVAVVAVIIAIGGYFYPTAKAAYGAILDTSYFDYFQASTSGGFKVGSNTVINGSGNITVPSGGTLTVTTGASATSTLSAGCINTYATSSATQIKLVYNTSATSSTINGGTIQGVVAWEYGACPI